MRDVYPSISASPSDYFGQQLNRNSRWHGLSVLIGSGGLVPLLHWTAISAKQVHEANVGELGHESHEVLGKQIFLEVVLVSGQHDSDISDRISRIGLDQSNDHSIVSHSRRSNSEPNTSC